MASAFGYDYSIYLAAATATLLARVKGRIERANQHMTSCRRAVSDQAHKGTCSLPSYSRIGTNTGGETLHIH